MGGQLCLYRKIQFYGQIKNKYSFIRVFFYISAAKQLTLIQIKLQL